MRYFQIDVEFNGFGGHLISLALVPEAVDGDPINEALPCPTPEPWTVAHVMPALRTNPISRPEMIEKLVAFLRGDPEPVIVADWPSLRVMPGKPPHDVEPRPDPSWLRVASFLGILPVVSALFGSDRIFKSRVIEGSGRTLIVENDDGDRFTCAFPTVHVLDVHPRRQRFGKAATPLTWRRSGSMTRGTSLSKRRERRAVPHAV